MSSTKRPITLDLSQGETYPLLINALSSYADVLKRQSAEQAERGPESYAKYLAGVAREAEELVALIAAAKSAD